MGSNNNNNTRNRQQHTAEDKKKLLQIKHPSRAQHSCSALPYPHPSREEKRNRSLLNDSKKISLERCATNPRARACVRTNGHEKPPRNIISSSRKREQRSSATNNKIQFLPSAPTRHDPFFRAFLALPDHCRTSEKGWWWSVCCPRAKRQARKRVTE